jgi:tetratricopeptide (TPR) repeat protein
MTADSPLEKGWDPYQILNVPRQASVEQIKRSYREKVKACHPDLGPEAGRVETFKRVTWAYRFLTNAARESGHNAAGGPASAAASGGTAADAPPEITPRPGRSGRLAEMLTAARQKMAAGAWTEAETIGRLAVHEDPQDPDAYFVLARVLAAQKSYAEAIGCLTLALHLEPNHEGAREALTALRQRNRETATTEPKGQR